MRPPVRILKLVSILGFLVAASLGLGADALILLRPDRAAVATIPFLHGEWVRWAPESDGGNRILSILSGIDLASEANDLQFNSRGEAWLCTNYSRLTQRGYFAARRRRLGERHTTLVLSPQGGVSSALLLLATDENSPVVRPVPYDAPLPPENLVLFEARSWDDVVALSRRCGGRVLVVEYPPQPETSWNRLWRLGSPWFDGRVFNDPQLSVPGLVDGRNVADLLLRPSRFQWREADFGRWGGPDRWLVHGHKVAPVVLSCLYWLFGVVVLMGFAILLNEERGPLAARLLRFLFLTPAVLVLAGKLSFLGGLDTWPLWTIVSAVVIGLLAGIGEVARRRWLPDAHRLWPYAAVGLLVMSTLGTTWSDFSPAFGRSVQDISSEALGAFMAYLTGAIAFARRSVPGEWFGRAIAGIWLLWSLSGDPWWVEGHPVFVVLPALGLAGAEGWMSLRVIPFLVLLPSAVEHVWAHGFTWREHGFVNDVADLGAVDVGRHVAFLGSPAFVTTFLVAGAMTLLGNRYALHRLQGLVREDPRRTSFGWTAAGLAAIGIIEPTALTAALIVLLGGVTVVLHDGLQEG